MNRRDAFRAAAAFVLGAPMAAEAMVKKPKTKITSATNTVLFPEGGIIFPSSKKVLYVWKDSGGVVRSVRLYDSTSVTLATWQTTPQPSSCLLT